MIFEDNFYYFLKLVLIIASLVNLLFSVMLYLQIQRYNKVITFHKKKLISIVKFVYVLLVLLSSVVIIII